MGSVAPCVERGKGSLEVGQVMVDGSQLIADQVAQVVKVVNEALPDADTAFKAAICRAASSVYSEELTRQHMMAAIMRQQMGR